MRQSSDELKFIRKLMEFLLSVLKLLNIWVSCLTVHYRLMSDPHRPKTCVYLISLSIVLKRLREHKLAYEYSEGSSQKTIYQAFE